MDTITTWWWKVSQKEREWMTRIFIFFSAGQESRRGSRYPSRYRAYPRDVGGQGGWTFRVVSGQDEPTCRQTRQEKHRVWWYHLRGPHGVLRQWEQFGDVVVGKQLLDRLRSSPISSPVETLYVKSIFKSSNVFPLFSMGENNNDHSAINWNY